MRLALNKTNNLRAKTCTRSVDLALIKSTSTEGGRGPHARTHSQNIELLYALSSGQRRRAVESSRQQQLITSPRVLACVLSSSSSSPLHAQASTMLEDNLTAVLYKPMDLRLEQTPIPEINDDEVLLRMDCVGICGSDVHYWTSGRCGPFVVEAPMNIGHEASGVVHKVGKNVTRLRAGDRVAIEPGVPCRRCALCREGRYHLCAEMKFCATPPVHGNLARYYKHAADFCYKLPEHVSMEEGALLEPLSVGVHACRRGGVSIGSSVLILGAGPIGLVTMLTARAMGASNILITDILQSRLDFAKQLGADRTLLVTRDADESELVQQIHASLGTQPDVSLDASGAQATVRLALLATKSSGVAVLIGMGGAELTLPLAGALSREVDIRGIFRYCNDYPLALNMVASGQINVKPLVTHHFSMEDTLKAFETARSGQGIKVMIHVQPKDTNNPK